MRKSLISTTALLLAVLMIQAGCTPTQPFYFREDGDLSFYLDKATSIETPDVQSSRLGEVQNAMAPLTITNPDFELTGVWVSSDAKATGDGTCKPDATSCDTIEMRAGDTEFFDLTTGGASKQYQLDLVKVIG